MPAALYACARYVYLDLDGSLCPTHLSLGTDGSTGHSFSLLLLHVCLLLLVIVVQLHRQRLRTFYLSPRSLLSLGDSPVVSFLRLHQLVLSRLGRIVHQMLYGGLLSTQLLGCSCSISFGCFGCNNGGSVVLVDNLTDS